MKNKKKLSPELLYEPAIPLLGMYTRDSTELQRHSCIHVYGCIIRRDKAMGTSMDDHSTEGWVMKIWYIDTRES